MSTPAALSAAFEREIASANTVADLEAILGCLELAKVKARVKAEAILSASGSQQMRHDENALFTVAEVADLLHVSQRMVRKRKKELGCIRVGRSLRFPRNSIDDYLRRRQRAS